MSENVTEEMCLAWRYIDEHHVTLVKYIAEEYRYSERAVYRHINGECNHTTAIQNINERARRDANGEDWRGEL